jgi:hypothetical protein
MGPEESPVLQSAAAAADGGPRVTNRAIPTSSMRGVVVVHGVCVEKFARVICGISKCLQPYREVILIEPLTNKLGVTTLGGKKVSTGGLRWLEKGRTVRRVHIGDIRVVRRLAGP